MSLHSSVLRAHTHARVMERASTKFKKAAFPIAPGLKFAYLADCAHTQGLPRRQDTGERAAFQGALTW